MDVYDGGNVNLGHVELEKRLRDVILDAERRWAAGERAVPVGTLTSDDRDTWTKVSNSVKKVTDLANWLIGRTITISLEFLRRTKRHFELSKTLSWHSV